MQSMNWMRAGFLIALVAGTLAAAEPEYEALTPDALRQEIKVFSRRNYAVFGFNDSGITIRLPHNDNSIYAVAEYAKPTVVDARGKPVTHEIEKGIYDFGTHTNEIRLQRVNGKTPLEFARVSGTIALKYPLVVKTTRLKKSPRIDGRLVHIDGLDIPEPATFSKILPVRAYDKNGDQLERDDAKSSHDVIAFQGYIAEVRIDRVAQWINVSITYDLPPAPLIPAEQAGLAQTMKTETPGGVVKVTIEK